MNPDQLNAAKVVLSDLEKNEYRLKGQEFVKGMIEHELGTEDDGWKLSYRKSDGMSCYLKYLDGDPICLVKGVSECNGDVKDIKKAMMHIQTSELFREEMSQLDPMFTGGALLSNHFFNEDSLLQLFYSNFSLAPGDVIWDRDMLFIQYTTLTKDRNDRVCVAACGSVDRPDFPLMSHLKRVRGIIQNTGYVFREIGPNKVRITYVVQVDPRGYLPPWVVNISAQSQAENTDRMVLRIHDSYKACRSMEIAPMSCELIQVYAKKNWILRVNPFNPDTGYQEPDDMGANRVQNMGMKQGSDSQILHIHFISTSDKISFKIEGLHVEDTKGLGHGAGQWMGKRAVKAGKAYRIALRLRRTQSLLLTWENASMFGAKLVFFKVQVHESEISPGLDKDGYIIVQGGSDTFDFDLDESISSNSNSNSGALSSIFYAQHSEKISDMYRIFVSKCANLVWFDARFHRSFSIGLLFAPAAVFIMLIFKVAGLLDSNLFILLAADFSLISAVSLLLQ
mmetsp:Transcript_17971/g.22637  ORF Transcript_17971/g.22637 Transcript_17971/m.22637 type:complete len:508 (+) Transcript_17971:112-1635(+)